MSDVLTTEDFGTVLLDARTAKGWTQEQLVDRCGNLLSIPFLSQLENKKKKRPGIETVDALAVALGRSRNEFRRLTDYPLIEEEARDEIGDEFADMLNQYKTLSDAGRKFVRRHLNSLIDFIFEVEAKPPTKITVPSNEKGGDTEPAKVERKKADLSHRPMVNLEQIKELHRRNEAAKLKKKD